MTKLQKVIISCLIFYISFAFGAISKADGLIVPPPVTVTDKAWTPTDASGAGLTLTITAARYSSINKVVTATFRVVYPVTANVTPAQIGGLPVPVSSTFTSNSYVVGTCFTGEATSTNVIAYINTPSATSFYMSRNDATNPTNVNLSGKLVSCSLNYISQ